MDDKRRQHIEPASKRPHERPLGAVEMMYSAAEIGARVGALAADIADAMGPDIMVVAVLKGGFVFTADLLRALHHHGVPRAAARWLLPGILPIMSVARKSC